MAELIGVVILLLAGLFGIEKARTKKLKRQRDRAWTKSEVADHREMARKALANKIDETINLSTDDRDSERERLSDKYARKEPADNDNA